MFHRDPHEIPPGNRRAHQASPGVGKLAPNLHVPFHPVKTYFHFRPVLPEIHRGTHRKIVYENRGPKQQGHVPENAGKTQFVLIFQIAAVAPFEHQHAEPVFSGAKLPRHFELAGAVGYLAVACKDPVHPYVKAGVHPFKIEELAHPRLPFGQLELADISAAGIFVRHIGRVVREGITDVGILLLVEALHLPASGHFGFQKSLRHKVFLEKMVRYFLHPGKIGKFPVFPRQRQTPVLPFFGQRHVVTPVGHGAHMQRFQIFIVIFQHHKRSTSFPNPFSELISSLYHKWGGVATLIVGELGNPQRGSAIRDQHNPFFLFR